MLIDGRRDRIELPYSVSPGEFNLQFGRIGHRNQRYESEHLSRADV